MEDKIGTPVTKLSEGTPSSGTQPNNLASRINFLERAGALGDLEDLRRESRELDSLVNDATHIVALDNVEAMMEFTTSRLNERFIPTHLAFVFAPVEETDPVFYCYRNLKPDNSAFPVSYFEPIRSFLLSQPYLISFKNLKAAFDRCFFKQDFLVYEPELILPMTGIGGIFGFVILGKKLVGGDYSELERMYLDRLVRFLSIGIQNKYSHEEAITEPKTGLYNSAYFMKRLKEEISRVDRYGLSSGILMLDIDHFKNFNDQWGHLAGDAVLRALAQVLRTSVRGADLPARFGGEEFCVLLSQCEESQLFNAAERIRKSIEALKVPYKDQVCHVTVSIGVCPLEPSWKGTPESFIDRADKALYQSKSNGRNQSTMYRFGLLSRALELKTGAKEDEDCGCGAGSRPN